MSRHGLLLAKKSRTCGEVIGGATAECTAVLCCCPFAAMDMLVLALYKAPRGMCRKAMEKKHKMKKHKMNKRLLNQRPNDVVLKHRGTREDAESDTGVAMVTLSLAEQEAAVDLKMYDKFYGTGFWRSSSQRSCSSL